MDNLMKFINEQSELGETVQDALKKIRTSVSYLAKAYGMDPGIEPTFDNLKNPEHRACLIGQAFAWASVKAFDFNDYIDGTATGSGTLDKIISDIREDCRKFCLNEIRLAMDTTLECLLAKESEETKGGE